MMTPARQWGFLRAPAVFFSLQNQLSRLLLFKATSELEGGESNRSKLRFSWAHCSLLRFSSFSWLHAPWIIVRFWLISTVLKMLILTNFAVYSIAFLEGQNLLWPFCWCCFFLPYFWCLNRLWFGQGKPFQPASVSSWHLLIRFFANQFSFLLVCNLRTFPGWNLKLVPIHIGQEERRRPLQIGRWQF